MTIGRLLNACGFEETPAAGAADMDPHAAYERYRAELDQLMFASRLEQIGEERRARMAARLRLETALDNDQACAVASALHELGKDVDWFVRFLPWDGTAYARMVVSWAQQSAHLRAWRRAGEQALIMDGVLSAYIDVSDHRIEINLPACGGEIEGDPRLWEKLYQTQIVGRAEPAAQPKDYLRHDPTKTHRRTKRRARR